jgi:hypothetical protein
MFLSEISKTNKELGFIEASQDFAAALEEIISAANHTNTMMWIGKMENCPLDLSGQGQLLKHEHVLIRNVDRNGKAEMKASNQIVYSGQLFLFKHTLVLGRSTENLTYLKHIG